jgi:hypothetical protein
LAAIPVSVYKSSFFFLFFKGILPLKGINPLDTKSPLVGTKRASKGAVFSREKQEKETVGFPTSPARGFIE